LLRVGEMESATAIHQIGRPEAPAAMNHAVHKIESVKIPVTALFTVAPNSLLRLSPKRRAKNGNDACPAVWPRIPAER